MRKRRRKLWIPRKKTDGLKKGALSRQLGIPEEKNIPMTLLNKIARTKIGETISNPTKTGRRRIKVTNLLKKRAVLARTLKRLHKRK